MKGEKSTVTIVGGSFIGLTLASALARAGITCTVLDREPRGTCEIADGRTSAIAYGSMLVLRGLGIWPRLESLAEPIVEIRVSDGASPFFLHYDRRALEGDLAEAPLGMIVENGDLKRVLLEHVSTLDTVSLRQGTSARRIERGPGGVMIDLGNEAIESQLVVGADGRESSVRAEAGIAVTRWRYPQTAIVCTVAHERPHRGIAHERFLPAGPFAILPMTGRRSSIVWTERSAEVPRLLALDDGNFLRELERRFGDFLGKLEVVSKRWSYPLGLVHADRYVANRLVLVGDAAHAIHPIAGQGLNLGIRDVAALSEILADAHRAGRDLGEAELLRRYERWRRFDSFALIAATDSLNRLFSNEIAPVRLVRDLGLAAVNRMPALKRLFMRHAMGMVGELPRLMRGEPL